MANALISSSQSSAPEETCGTVGKSERTCIFVPLVTPFLYGMERAVIELFDSLRPDVQPYFLQSNRIFERQPPIIREMLRRGFALEFLPDKTDWERLGRPKSFKHLCQMLTAFLR